MVREFTEEARNRLINQIGEIQTEDWWWFADVFQDMLLQIEKWLGILSLNDDMSNVEAYHKSILDMSDYKEQDIQEIFTAVSNTEMYFAQELTKSEERLLVLKQALGQMADAVEFGGSAQTSTKFDTIRKNLKNLKITEQTGESVELVDIDKKMETMDSDELLSFYKDVLSTLEKLSGETDKMGATALGTIAAMKKAITAYMDGKITEKEVAGVIKGGLDPVSKCFKLKNAKMTTEIQKKFGVISSKLSLAAKMYGAYGEVIGIKNAVIDGEDVGKSVDKTIYAVTDLGVASAKYVVPDLFSSGLDGVVESQGTLTGIATVGVMGIHMGRSIDQGMKDGKWDAEDTIEATMDTGVAGGATLVKGCTLGLVDIDVDGAKSVYNKNSEAVSNYLSTTGLPLWAQCVGDVVASPFVFLGSTQEILENHSGFAAHAVISGMSNLSDMTNKSLMKLWKSIT